MCNCTKMANLTGERPDPAGFLNYAGKPAADGKNFTAGFGNYSGPAVIDPLKPVGSSVSSPKITAPSVQMPVQQPQGALNTAPVAAPVPARKSVWDVAASAMDIFARPKPAAVIDDQDPEKRAPEGGVPKAVWIVLGVLVVLGVVYFVVKANKK